MLNYSTKEPISSWDERFLNLAKHISDWSKDPSTKCGAVITSDKRIISLGFNGFPMGVKDRIDRLQTREIKYKMILHAEENAIIFSTQSLSGCTIYTWPFPPCANCASKIIQSGITRVVSPTPSGDLLDRWESSLTLSEEMYSEVGIEFLEVIIWQED